MNSKSTSVKRYDRSGGKEKKEFLKVYVLLAGILSGLLSVAIVARFTLVSAVFISKVFCFCCVIGLLMPYKWYKSRWDVNRLGVFQMNVLGFGPLLCSGLLWINFLFAKDHQTVTYKIEEAKRTYMHVIFDLENNAFQSQREVRKFELTNDVRSKINGKSIRYQTATGFFGYGVVLDREILE